MNLTYVKNKEHFFFRIDAENRILTENKCSASSAHNEVQIFLDGIIYNQNKKQLVDGFRNEGVDFIKQVEGSFVLFLIKDAEFYIITDKVNSRKAFYCSIDGFRYISNNVDLLPIQDAELSLSGIASYLANGAMLNNLTLFKEIKCSTLAAVHFFSNKNISISSYWTFKFNYPDASTIKSEPDYQKELESLLIKSVKRRFATASGALLSLSAGYDARGILGILKQKVGASDVFCFSYGSKHISNPKADAQLSKRLANKCDYPHVSVKSFQGDYISYLMNNATEGKCLSYFCDELDAWHSMEDINPYSDIFVGDVCFVSKVVPMHSDVEILDSLSITGKRGIKSLKKFIPEHIFAELSQSLDVLNDNLIKKTASFTEALDKRDFLYFDQRLNHVLMPGRENICSRLGFVHNPYLDGEILDFVKALPPKHRKKKRLFKQTLENMLPDLFEVEQSSLWDDFTNHKEELIKNRKELIELIENTTSRLDQIIPKNKQIAIIKTLKPENSLHKMSYIFLKTYHYLRRNYRFINQLFSLLGIPRIPKGGLPQPLEKIIVRLLLIRIYLAEEKGVE